MKPVPQHILLCALLSLLQFSTTLAQQTTTIGDVVYRIENNFAYVQAVANSGTKNLVIPNEIEFERSQYRVAYIDKTGLANCKELINIELPETLKSLEFSLPSKISVLTISPDYSIDELRKLCQPLRHLQTIHFRPYTTRFSYSDACLFANDGGDLLFTTAGAKLTDGAYSIPEHVRRIHPNAIIQADVVLHSGIESFAENPAVEKCIYPNYDTTDDERALAIHMLESLPSSLPLYVPHYLWIIQSDGNNELKKRIKKLPSGYCILNVKLSKGGMLNVYNFEAARAREKQCEKNDMLAVIVGLAPRFEPIASKGYRAVAAIIGTDTITSFPFRRVFLAKKPRDFRMLFSPEGVYEAGLDYRLSSDGKTLLRWNATPADGSLDLSKFPFLSTVTTIGPRAFSTCKNLVTLTLPHNISHVESLAFDNCPQLRQLKFSGELSHVDPQSLSGASTVKVIEVVGAPASSTEQIKNAFGVLPTAPEPVFIVPAESLMQWKSCVEPLGFKVRSSSAPLIVRLLDFPGGEVRVTERHAGTSQVHTLRKKGEKIELPSSSSIEIEPVVAISHAITKFLVNGEEVEGKTFKTNLPLDLDIAVATDEVRHAVVFSSSAGGDITVTDSNNQPLSSGATVRRGDRIHVKLTPHAGGRIAQCKYNGAVAHEGESEFDIVVRGYTEIDVKFSRPYYRISWYSSPKYNVEVQGKVTALEGTSVRVHANESVRVVVTPADGYEVVQLLWNAKPYQAGSLKPVDEPVHLDVVAARKSHEVLVDKSLLEIAKVTDSYGNRLEERTRLSDGEFLSVVLFDPSLFTRFSLWDGANEIRNTKRIPVTKSLSLRAEVKYVLLTIRVKQPEHAKIVLKASSLTQSGDNYTVNIKDPLTVDLEVEDGYQVDEFRVGSHLVKGKRSFLITPLENLNIYSIVSPLQCLVSSIGHMRNGRVIVRDVNGNQIKSGETVSYGTTVSLSSEPRLGYRLAELRVNGEACTPNTPIVVKGALTYYASFEKAPLLYERGLIIDPGRKQLVGLSANPDSLSIAHPEVTSIAHTALKGAKARVLFLGGGLKNVTGSALGALRQLEELYIDQSIEKVESSTLIDCQKLKLINLLHEDPNLLQFSKSALNPQISSHVIFRVPVGLQQLYQSVSPFSSFTVCEQRCRYLVQGEPGRLIGIHAYRVNGEISLFRLLQLPGEIEVRGGETLEFSSSEVTPDSIVGVKLDRKPVTKANFRIVAQAGGLIEVTIAQAKRQSIALPKRTAICENTARIVAIAPNPAKEWIEIRTLLPFHGTYSLYSQTGQLIKSGLITPPVARLYVGDLSNGLYHLLVHTATTRQVQSLLVRR